MSGMGPILLRRSCFDGHEQPAVVFESDEDLIQAYLDRVDGVKSADQRERIREKLLSETGAVTYDQIAREFELARDLAGFGKEVTLRQLRHHFSRAMEIAGLSEYTRKYLMGHKLPKEALAVYTQVEFSHIVSEYNKLLAGTLAPIIQAMTRRLDEIQGAISRRSVKRRHQPIYSYSPQCISAIWMPHDARPTLDAEQLLAGLGGSRLGYACTATWSPDSRHGDRLLWSRMHAPSAPAG